MQSRKMAGRSTGKFRTLTVRVGIFLYFTHWYIMDRFALLDFLISQKMCVKRV